MVSHKTGRILLMLFSGIQLIQITLDAAVLKNSGNLVHEFLKSINEVKIATCLCVLAENWQSHQYFVHYLVSKVPFYANITSAGIMVP